MGLSGEEFGIKGIWLMKRPESVMEGLGFVDGCKMDGVRLGASPGYMVVSVQAMSDGQDMLGFL